MHRCSIYASVYFIQLSPEKYRDIKHINAIKMRNKNEKMQDWMQEVFHTESNSQLWITLWISVNKPEKSDAS